MSNNPYNNLRDAILAEVREWLRRLRIPAANLDGAIDWSNLPPGSYVPDPRGGGDLTPGPHTHDTAELENTYNLLAGTGITLVPDEAADTITINATGGGGGETWELIAGPGILITQDTEANTLTVSAIGGGDPVIYTTLTDSDGYELIDDDGTLLVEAY
jgi:hypothetical protein